MSRRRRMSWRPRSLTEPQRGTQQGNVDSKVLAILRRYGTENPRVLDSSAPGLKGNGSGLDLIVCFPDGTGVTVVRPPCPPAFGFLAVQEEVDNVNFWQPSAGSPQRQQPRPEVAHDR